MAYYRDEWHRSRVISKRRYHEGITGYPIGKWARQFRKYPYKELPVYAALVFEDIATGIKAACAAQTWGRRNNVKYTYKIKPNCVELWRLS